MTWISLQDEVTGNPIGMGSNLTFAGSGELDNGWTVDLSIAHKNANAYSTTTVTVGVPGLGDFLIIQGGSGTGIDRMDDSTPNRFGKKLTETGLGHTMDTVSGASGGAGIEFTPSGTPDGLTARFSWSPNVSGSGSADKGSSATDTGLKQSGWDLTLDATSDLTGMEGLSIYGGISQVEVDQTGSAHDNDAEERTIGVKYAVGSFTLGYQWSEEEKTVEQLLRLSTLTMVMV